MKLRLLPVVILLLTASSLAFGQADSISNWKTGAVINLSFSQVALKNWAGGGQNSVSVNTLVSVFANYAKGDLTWGNSLDIGYGVIQQGKDTLGNANPFVKSDDRLILISKVGYKAVDNWKYSGMLDFRTQMTSGYDDPLAKTNKISNLLSPGTGILSLGMEYQKNDMFSIFISPLSGKFVTVFDQVLADSGSFGVDKIVYSEQGQVLSRGKNLHLEFGGFLSTTFKKEIMKNVFLNTKLTLFSNYLDRPENIDVNWDFLINMQVNKYITVTFGNTLIYDNNTDAFKTERIAGVGGLPSTNVTKNIGPQIQLKQIFGAGLKFQFLSK